MYRRKLLYLLLTAIVNCCYSAQEASAEDLRVLFLGDNGHHRPRERYVQLRAVFQSRGITLTYTDDMADMNREKLDEFDVLAVYANIDRIEPAHEQALLDYVAGGGGFVPIHCATFCFRNSDKVVALMGAQFKRHGTGVFRTQIESNGHPVMRGFEGFESWDETYVHHLHNDQNRTVLAYRVDQEGREPWTWVRTHGKGRVFYTAWGHDGRTWSNPGFHNLIERGMRWAAGRDLAAVPPYQRDLPFVVPEMTAQRTDKKPLEYIDVGAQIPNYPPSERWGTQDEPLTKMQQPLSPEESMKHMVTPVGFHVELFAAEPDLGGKPIAMNWDERGRLWVCETYDYPNELQPPGKGRDRIRICEDTDLDGRADKFTIFAENLSIPTAITFHRGGAIVQNGTETLYLKDTNGDDRADIRKVLISNWSLGDTHGGVSNLRYGLDNWFWGMQGYNNSEPIVDGKKLQGFRMGFFRFRLDDKESPGVKDFEFIRSTNNNTWGIGISEEGVVFGSTANRNPSVYMPIPNRYYERVRGWVPQQLGTIADSHRFKPLTRRVRQVDHHGGYTAGAGHALYTARAYPRQWWNRTAFVCGPTGHLVGTYVLRAQGADFKSTSPCNLLASTDEWTAPIVAEVGPDGHVWILDWYNYIVQHNPTPRGFERGKGNAYETKLRDKKHGRIYRIAYKAAKPEDTQFSSLQGAPAERLVQTLRHSNMRWRLEAQRLLVERGRLDVVPALIQLVRDDAVDQIGASPHVIHAMHTLAGLGAIQADDDAREAVLATLRHPSAGVRRNAVQVCSTGGLEGWELAPDTDSQVTLALLLGIAQAPEEPGQGGAAVLEFLENGVLQDRWLSDAATVAAAAHALPFLQSLAHSDAKSSWSELVEVVAEHVARGRPADDAVSALAQSLRNMPPEIALAAIKGLHRGWAHDHRPQLSRQAEDDLMALLDRMPAAGKGALVQLARAWGSREFRQQSEKIAQSLLVTLADVGSSDEARIGAARQLVGLLPDDADIVVQLLQFVTPQAVPEFSRGVVESLGGMNADVVASPLVSAMAAMTPGTREAAMGVLLRRPETTAALLDGLEDGRLQLTDLKLDQRRMLGDHPDRELRRQARRLLASGGVLPDADRERVVESLIPITKEPGDVHAGKLVFQKHCAKCHIYRGEGVQIGPNLTGMAVHPKVELLVHIIDPGRSVEGNFRLYTVVTKDGLVRSGMLAAETKTAIELIDTEAKRHVVPRSEIEELVASRKSVMPDGFEKQVDRKGLTDLLEYLTDKGRYVPLSLTKVATAISTRGMFHPGDDGPDRIVFPDWKPRSFAGVPFEFTDPLGKTQPNLLLLHGTLGTLPPKMPKSISLPCNMPLKAIHMLSGVSGWGYPAYQNKTDSLVVRLHYVDGSVEDHGLKNGVHFSDYIRRVDVPGSVFAFKVRDQQLRYLSVEPKRAESIKEIELRKGDDPTSPIVVAVTLEGR